MERIILGGSLRMPIEPPRDVTQVRVDGIRLHVPTSQHAVILVDDEADRHLPIWIGPQEASAIASGVSGLSVSRPMTHDLLYACLQAAGLRVAGVTIWRSPDQEDLYLAAIEVAKDGQTELLDARPSDAINVAIRAEVPVYVASQTLRERAASRAQAATPTPADISISVIHEDGRSLALLDVHKVPESGDHLHLQQDLEVTGIVERQHGGYEVRVRDAAKDRYRVNSATRENVTDWQLPCGNGTT